MAILNFLTLLTVCSNPGHSLVINTNYTDGKKRKEMRAMIRKIRLVTTTMVVTTLVAGTGSQLVGQVVVRADTPTSSISAPSGQGGTPPSGQPGGADTQTYDYTGTLAASLNVKAGTKQVGAKTLTNTQSDQNVALVQGTGQLTLTGTKLEKSGAASSDDNANFYGLDSILLANGKKAVATVKNATLTSSASGANGIFATNSGTVNVTNTTIKTTGKANSRGLDATYGGKINANQVKISTSGDHSAALATDRGGGTVTVKNSHLTTKGSGSPLIYSTGTITVNKVNGTASGSQIAGMEGYNQITIVNSRLTSSSDKNSGSDPIKNGVIIYQSTSGDAETSSNKQANFVAKNSILKTAITSGAMFYVTNTSGKITLENTKLKFASDKVALLNVAGNDSNNWGTKGQNGGHVTLTLKNQTTQGKIEVDSISSANVKLTGKTVYTGQTQLTTNKNATSSSTSKTPLTMSVGTKSKWVVTGNSTVTNLTLARGGKIVDNKGRTVKIIANGKTVQKGSSPYTVTVTNTFTNK